MSVVGNRVSLRTLEHPVLSLSLLAPRGSRYEQCRLGMVLNFLTSLIPYLRTSLKHPKLDFSKVCLRNRTNTNCMRYKPFQGWYPKYWTSIKTIAVSTLERRIFGRYLVSYWPWRTAEEGGLSRLCFQGPTAGASITNMSPPSCLYHV